MLKRQRPATPPPPSSLGDPLFLLNGPPIRSLQPSHSTDSFERRSKRQRTRPPSLSSTERGWLQSEPAGPQWESDGEEEWIEDEAPGPPPSTVTVDRYKDANNLLHELHVLNQHRLLFAHSSRDLYPNPNPRPPLGYTHPQDHPPGQRLAAPRDTLAGRSCVESAVEKGFVQEVQCVRQHYEDTNRFLGSLFLSRRREMEGITPSDFGLSN